MANFTTNYNLKKPLTTENYDIADQNGNMDIIDTQLKSHTDDLTTKGTQITNLQNQDISLTNQINQLRLRRFLGVW